MSVYDGSVKAILYHRPVLPYNPSATWKTSTRGMDLTVIISTCGMFGQPSSSCSRSRSGVLFFSSFDSITAVLLCKHHQMEDYDDISVEYVDHYCLSFPEAHR